ncbi:hypothetical protein C0J52_15183 [Blattella germanica]|nr:hypothetical protein C0J52_15183 [Blattella germanica]
MEKKIHRRKKREYNYFNNILTNDETLQHETIHYNYENFNDNNIEEQLPTLKVQTAVQKLKNGNAPGVENLQVELLKYGGQECLKQILELITCIWKTEILPDKWNCNIPYLLT